MEDEFTCPRVLQESLLELKPTIQRVFGVTLRMGTEQASRCPQDELIWLHLRGKRRRTEAAKLFVKGLVNQESQKEVQYPLMLQCIFHGARGFFTDCLISMTSAHIVVGSVGCLLISGLDEPVVQAYSLIVDLLEKHKNSQLHTSIGEIHSMESRLRFKSLVNDLEDSHTLHLLVLPAIVKEVLLDLVKQSELDPENWRGKAGFRPELEMFQDDLKRQEPKESERSQNKTFEQTRRPNTSFHIQDPQMNFRYSVDDHGGTHEEEVPSGNVFRSLVTEPTTVKVVPQKKPVMDSEVSCQEHNVQDQNEETLLSTGSKQENEHLLKFFTAMGFKEEVVCRVLARTGPREPSKVLDLIQQEQLKTGLSSQNVNEPEEENNFVLGVLKKAAVSCGYTEEKVDEIYSIRPEVSPHQLILELQQKTPQDPEIINRVDPKVQPVAPQKTKAVEKPRMENFEKVQDIGGTSYKKQEVCSDVVGQGPAFPFRPSAAFPPPNHTVVSNIRGPPQPSYPHPVLQNISAEPAVTKPKKKTSTKAGTVITGQQRFLEGLEVPFNLQLEDKPGDPGLRQIIIDGSNVAMSHGLGQYFSCRGMALAVQYFWNRGHRRISAFVPQWRQKKDPRIKEQRFMMQLQDLGLLSFTPSREVKGHRINSYDDRLMLQMARQTDGVIVTNDNMRDLVDESIGWKEIIKSRLLQYLFAGDLFMVPDDPLGRTGPHIDEFLRSQNSPPAYISHSFAGVSSSSLPTSSQPHAQTEILQYRERTPGSAGGRGRVPLERKLEETLRIKQDLVEIFPGQENVITMTLQCHPTLTNINQLSHFILEQIDPQL